MVRPRLWLPVPIYKPYGCVPLILKGKGNFLFHTFFLLYVFRLLCLRFFNCRKDQSFRIRVSMSRWHIPPPATHRVPPEPQTLASTRYQIPDTVHRYLIGLQHQLDDVIFMTSSVNNYKEAFIRITLTKKLFAKRFLSIRNPLNL